METVSLQFESARIRSRNELINLILAHGVKNIEIE